MKPLILGVGNILLSDEGVGVRVVQELEKRPEIQPHFDIIDGGTCGMELLDAMANREHLIIVDAVLANKQPGEISCCMTSKCQPFSLAKFRHTNSAFVMYFLQ